MIVEFLHWLITKIMEWLALQPIYYGCPNSNKAKKLQLKQRIFR